MPNKRPLSDEQKAARAAYMKEYRKSNPEKVREHAKRSREKNKDKVRARQKKWREDNREYVSAKGKEWYQENKEHQANVMMLRRVNMSLKQYADMLELQGGVCAICGATESRKGELVVRFSVDHDRSCCPGDSSCGACVRGLLCTHCNLGIGHLRDDPTLLEAAIAYLKKHRGDAAQQGIEVPQQP